MQQRLYWLDYSTRSADYWNWHDWTARIEHLIPLKARSGVPQPALRQ
jgi:hypothetical protein